MKSDLDALMSEQGVAALLVLGPAQHNPAMVYLAGIAHLTDACLVKKCGEAPVLFYNPMERDEAANTGLATHPYGNASLPELVQQHQGNFIKALAARLQQALAAAGVEGGKVVVCGRQDAGAVLEVLGELQRMAPELTFAGDTSGRLLLQAMQTKSEAEVARIRRMGAVTVTVVANTADFLTAHKVQDGVLIKADGSPLTIGDVKRKIALWVAERGAETPEETIFAIGGDAAVPHSAGNPDDVLRLGQTIVYDIFPCEAGGGYFYDFTRTWCLGYAPDEAQRLHEDVLAVYRQLRAELKAGAPGKGYQQRACELFAARGHPTTLDHPGTQEGYVHGLGHGVGLNIHERPVLTMMAGERDRLEPGAVITVEPGLYYPERGLGMRIEDTVWVREDGEIETLAEYPYDLVLQMKEK